MEFYLDIIYWENILFTEISIIINNHFNVLSEGKKKKLAQQLSLGGQPSWVSLPPPTQAIAQINQPVTCADKPAREASMPPACTVWSCPGHNNTFSHYPLSPLDKSCSSSLRTVCRTQAVPFLWMTAIYHHEDAWSNINTLRLIIRLYTLPMRYSLREPC